MTILLITPPISAAREGALYDCVISRDGRSVESHSQHSAAELPIASSVAATKTVLILPIRALSWHRTQLPLGTLRRGWLKDTGAARQRAVLEGLLEDQLLDEPAQLHFALQPHARDDAPVWIGVCDRAWLQAVLDVLAQAGHTPSRIVPEWAPEISAMEAEPGKDNSFSLWVTGTIEAARLVWTDDTGVHDLPLPTQSGDPASVHGLVTDIFPAHFASHATLLAEPGVAQLAEHLFHREPRVIPTAKRLLYAIRTEWNLAQFDLVRRNPLLSRIRAAAGELLTAPEWRVARWAALAVVVVNILGLNAAAWHTKTLLKQQNAEIRNTLVQTFPEMVVVVDAPVQMQQAVGALRRANGAADKGDLETLLGMFSAFHGADPQATVPKSMDYMSGELRLSGSTLNEAQTAEMDTALQAHGFSSKWEADVVSISPRSAP